MLTLPFGLIGAVLAARGIPNLHTSIWIIVALVSARSAAMAFNRLVDADIDAENPRTKIRALACGQAEKAICVGICGCHFCDLDVCRVATESAVVLSLAGGAGDRLFLFVHQALYALGTRGARPGDGNSSRGGMDRGARLIRSAHSATDRRCGFLGRWLRHPLQLPGLRVRSRGQCLFRPQGFRHSQIRC